jgi:tetratricopeptide (TPR) repeat protein
MQGVCLGLVVLGLAAAARGESGEARALVEKGNTLYRAGLYDEAGKKYLQAEKIAEQSPIITYNLGNVYHQKLLEKQGRGDMPGLYDRLEPDQQELVDKAVEAYKQALQSSSPTLCAQALYNLGNTYAAAGLVNEAILSYREALRLIPDDGDTKHNLELLLNLKKQKKDVPPADIVPPSGVATNRVAIVGAGAGLSTNGVRRTKGTALAGQADGSAGGENSGQGSGSAAQAMQPDKNAKGKVALPTGDPAEAWGVREGGGYQLEGASTVAAGGQDPGAGADPGGSGASASAAPGSTGPDSKPDSSEIAAGEKPEKSDLADTYEAAPPRQTRSGRPLNAPAKRTLEKASEMEVQSRTGASVKSGDAGPKTDPLPRSPETADEPDLKLGEKDW